ncbi:class I tRNA ligase family protein [Streptomyces sp. KR80]|uniref:class I tRNA ligase family protein n=1 Tax=Streptomyces sp. KR80 TaxID=3457426 RepID=UPI003FD20B47
MTKPWFRTSSRRRYFLVPLMPTPNGRLHLGHIAGPFLRMDILARNFRRRGDDAVVIFGTDAYDSYVPLAAKKDGCRPEDVCHRHHALIQQDLAAMDIDVDEFINPIDPRWQEPYDRSHRAFAEHLISTDRVVSVRESVPYCTVSDRYLVGGFLSGRCPDCMAEVANFLCESCGAHLRPDELLSAQPRFNDGPVEWRPVDSLFILLPEERQLLKQLTEMGIPEELREGVGRYVRRHGPLARLTTPGRWGVQGDYKGASPDSILFSYTGLLPYSLYCGEVYRDLDGQGRAHPFAPDSDVITIASCGTDNLVSALAAVVGGAMTHGEVRPFDHLLLNHLYNLERKKFSTSRGHAIWVADITSLPGLPVDAVRYFLAVVNPEDGPASLNVAEFIEVYNHDLAGRLTPQVAAAVGAMDRAGHPSEAPADGLAGRLEELLDEQDRALEPPGVSTAGAASAMRSWIHDELPADDGQAYWWLKGLALLSYPIAPRMSGALWSGLGHSGAPSLAGFSALTTPGPIQIPAFPALDWAGLEPVLPDSLRADDLPPELSPGRYPQGGADV